MGLKNCFTIKKGGNFTEATRRDWVVEGYLEVWLRERVRLVCGGISRGLAGREG
jgi:hypothetical protein